MLVRAEKCLPLVLCDRCTDDLWDGGTKQFQSSHPVGWLRWDERSCNGIKLHRLFNRSWVVLGKPSGARMILAARGADGTVESHGN